MSNIEVCPVCGVKIVAGNRVLFSAGPPGDRAKLWSRVCKYVKDKKKGCINEAAEFGAQVNQYSVSLDTTLFK